ncbi:MAG: hypothetical protein ABSF21_00995 [Dehalococcoidia bacterium]
MSERKNLTITEVEEIKKIGDKQFPILPFRVKGQEEKHSYFTARSSLFEAIKVGQTIIANVETEQRGEYTNHKVVQIYLDGQPVSVKKEGYRGKSPEEIEQSVRSQCCSYAKDLAVADKIPVVEIINQADVFYNWLKKNGLPKAPEPKLGTEIFDSPEGKSTAPITKPNIDMDWLKESLETLNWTDVSKWLKKKYPKAIGTSIKALVESLTKEQQEEFVKEVQNRLEASGIE